MNNIERQDLVSPVSKAPLPSASSLSCVATWTLFVVFMAVFVCMCVYADVTLPVCVCRCVNSARLCAGVLTVPVCMCVCVCVAVLPEPLCVSACVCV